jgi:hypothetical protein
MFIRRPKHTGADAEASVVRCESRNTKTPELKFSALLGDDDARNVRFERASYGCYVLT